VNRRTRKGDPPLVAPVASPVRDLAALAVGLSRVGGRPPLRRYLADVWARRQFTWQLAKSRFRAQNEESRLGSLWIVLSPLIQGAVYGTVFHFLLRDSTRPGNFIAFLLAGVFIFHFMSGCLTNGANAIVGNRGLIHTVRFPRAVLPISVVLIQVLDLIPTILLLLPIAVASGEPVQWEWVYLVPSLAMCAVFSQGMAFVAAWLTVLSRDFQHLLPYITRVMFYTSGVFFSVDRMGIDSPWIHAIFTYNPFHVFIALARRSVMDDQEIVVAAGSQMWLAAGTWTVVMLVTGIVLFWVAEERYGKE